MLSLGAALREFYKVKSADYNPIPVGVNVRSPRGCGGTSSSQVQKESVVPVPVQMNGESAALQENQGARRSMFLQLAEDEFFDVPEDLSWDMEPGEDSDSQMQQTESEETASDSDQVKEMEAQRFAMQMKGFWFTFEVIKNGLTRNDSEKHRKGLRS